MGMARGDSHEINVTPLIDVLLVLLVIFLLIMPVMVRFHTVELPPRSDAPSETIALVLKLEADLSASIDDGPRFPARDLAGQLRGRLTRATAVFLDAVDSLPWGMVVTTVDTVRGVANDVSPSLAIAVRLRGDG